MPVPEQIPIATFTGNGVTTDFSFAWGAGDASHVVIEVDDVELVQGVDYTVLSIGDAGGTVQIAPAPADGAAITAFRRTPLERVEIDYQESGPFLAETVDLDFNTAWRAIQEIGYSAVRAPQLPIGSPLAGLLSLPPPGAGKYLRWNAAGDNLEAADVEVLDGVVASDFVQGLLDAADGNDFLGRIPTTRAEAGASAVPVLAKLRETVTAEDFSATGDGVADDTTKLQSAIDALAAAGGGDLLLARTYRVKDVVLKSGVNLVGRGGAKLVKAGGQDETYIVKGAGTLGASTAISAAVAVGAQSFTVASASGFAVGDWIIVRDATYIAGAAGRNQEINRIAGIAGTTITLQRPTHGAYSGSQEMVLLTPVEAVRIEGIEFELPVVAGGNVGGGVYLQYAVGCAVRSCRFKGAGGDAAVGFDTVAFSGVEGCDFEDGQNLSGGGYGYGISFNEATHHCIARGNTSRNIREHTFTNRTRLCAFVGNAMSGHFDTGFNTHGAGVSDCVVANNVVDGTQTGNGIAVGYGTNTGVDTRIEIVGNTIRGVSGNGISVVGSGAINPSNIKVIGNQIHMVGLAGGSFAGVYSTNSIDLRVEGNTIYGANDAGAANGVFAGNAAGVAVVGNRIRSIGNGYGITLDTVATGLVQGNDIAGASSFNVRGLGASTNVIVRDNVADDTSVSIPASGWASSGNSWDRWFEQAGTAQITVSGASAGFVDVVFPIPFSVVPIVFPSVANAVGAWSVAYSSVTTTGFRITATDVAGTSRTGTFEVSWIAKGR